jgi:hypothetical protein
MSDAAQLHEVDQLGKLRDALARFKMQADGALGTAQAQIQRVLETIDRQLDYWRGEVNRRTEDVARARADLGFHRSLHKGEHVGETDLQLRFKVAQQRLREAEEKVQCTTRWQRKAPQAIHDYEGPARHLSGFLDTELRKALAVLDNQVASLEAYLTLTPDEPKTPAPTIEDPVG